MLDFLLNKAKYFSGIMHLSKFNQKYAAEKIAKNIYIYIIKNTSLFKITQLMQNQSTRQMPKWFLNNKQFLEFQKKTEQCQSLADTYQQSKCVSNFHFALP